MRRIIMVAWLLATVEVLPVAAQEKAAEQAPKSGPVTEFLPSVPAPEVEVPVPATTVEEAEVVAAPLERPYWYPVWGLVGLRAIPGGSRVAPNGLEYHQNFSLDVGVNFWVWRSQGIYLFADIRMWGQKNEQGVTNAKDGVFATSKREFDAIGGAAWNYMDRLEFRAWGYTYNNLNRGSNPITPTAYGDGLGLENRLYLSSEYTKLGLPTFDVSKASFVSIGYLPTKTMTGNDGQPFDPGLMARAYLTYDLWDWPVYVYGDVQYVGQKDFASRLLIYDLGIAVRPFRRIQQCEFRLGSEDIADFQAHHTTYSWYVALRFIY